MPSVHCCAKRAGFCRDRRDRRLSDGNQCHLADRHPGARKVRRHQYRRADMGSNRGPPQRIAGQDRMASRRLRSLNWICRLPYPTQDPPQHRSGKIAPRSCAHSTVCVSQPAFPLCLVRTASALDKRRTLPSAPGDFLYPRRCLLWSAARNLPGAAWAPVETIRLKGGCPALQAGAGTPLSGRLEGRPCGLHAASRQGISAGRHRNRRRQRRRGACARLLAELTQAGTAPAAVFPFLSLDRSDPVRRQPADEC